MILANTVTSSAVQGVTVPAAADDNPLQGFSAVGTGSNWVGTPGSFNAALSALGTPTAGTVVNLDWTAAGLFTMTMPSSGTSTFQFATTATAALAAAKQVASFSLGQTIQIVITGTGGVTVAWPTTISWVGVGTATDGVHAAPTLTSVTTVIYLTCTGVGTSPTFIGFYITG